jgi:hypothetical protein
LTFNKAHLLRDGRHLDAELLSPGHPLFAATSDILNEQLADIRNGCAAFVDPAAGEAYRLYFFELQVLGEQGPEQPGGPPRTVVVHAELAVVCESADGSFELAAPDVLHDLTPLRERPDIDPIGPDNHRLAERWLRVHPAQTVMSEQRARRTHELSIRRDYMERSFDELERRRMARYSEFAAKVASGDDSYRLARDEAWRAREELQRRREQKLGELAHLEVLRPGPAAFLGSAVVVPLDDDRIASLARGERSSEEKAIEVAMTYERNSGWAPDYIGELRDGSGFDIRSTRRRTNGSVDVRRIEVKGHLGSDPTSILTPNEWTQARRHGESYWLYVVSECANDTPKLRRIRNPYARLHRQAETLTIVKGHLIPGDAVARTAEEAS